MTERFNPLTAASEPKRAWNLDDFCDASNRLAWVRHSGKPYFLSPKLDMNGDQVCDKYGIPLRELNRNA